MKRLITVACVLTSLLVVSACGSSNKASTAPAGSQSAPTGGQAAPSTTGESGNKIRFAKTKFVLHAGLAFGAFHRYIYKPFKRGTFASAGRVRKGVILVKASLAALFAYHELKLAATDVQASPLLRKLFSPLTALSARIRGLSPGLRNGQANSSQIEASNGSISSLSQQSAAAGSPVKDINPPANLQPVA